MEPETKDARSFDVAYDLEEEQFQVTHYMTCGCEIDLSELTLGIVLCDEHREREGN